MNNPVPFLDSVNTPDTSGPVDIPGRTDGFRLPYSSFSGKTVVNAPETHTV